MIHVFLISLMLFWTQSPNSSLTLVVRDAADRPVVGLTLSLIDADGTRQNATTNASGRATFAGLHGSSITLTTATAAAGQPIKLDPTTPKDGLVLGLIPLATRVVPLRLVDGLLFLDPEEIFAGTDESTTAAPTPAVVPFAAAGAGDTVAAPDPSIMPMGALPILLLWCIGVPLLFLVCLTAFVRFARGGR